MSSAVRYRQMLDDHPYPKDYLWLKALGMMVLISGAIGTGVWRCSARQDGERGLALLSRLQREKEAELQALLARHRKEPPPAGSSEAPQGATSAATSEGGPIRFEVVSGEEVRDVSADGRVALADGTRLVVAPRPSWVYRGDGFHFRHSSSMSVTRGSNGMIVASMEAVHLQLMPFPRRVKRAGARTALADMAAGLDGVAPAIRKSRRRIAGKSVTGELRRSGDQEIEVYLLSLGRRHLGAFLYYPAGVPVDSFEELLASMRAGSARPDVEFEVGVEGSGAPIFTQRGKPFAIPGGEAVRSITVRERRTVRRAMGGLTFEHPLDLSARLLPNDLLPVVKLEGSEVMIFVFRTPPGMRESDVIDGMGAALGGSAPKDMGPARRTFGAESLAGHRYKMHLGAVPFFAEFYALERGGKQLSVFVRYAADNEEAALRRADPVVASLR